MRLNVSSHESPQIILQVLRVEIAGLTLRGERTASRDDVSQSTPLRRLGPFLGHDALFDSNLT